MGYTDAKARLYEEKAEKIEGKEKKEGNLEIVQNRAARRGLGTKRHVATEALREMGWSALQERKDKTKIKYRVRLEHKNDKRWAKKIFKWRGRKNRLHSEKKHRNMRRIDMKITSNDEDLEMKVNGEKVEGKKSKTE